MDNLIIRKATSDDMREVIEINSVVWNTTYKGLLPDELVGKMTENKETRILSYQEKINKEFECFVAIVDEKIIGYITYGKSSIPQYPDYMEEYAIYVLDGYQKKGIGTQLVSMMKNQMKKVGHNKFITTCVVGNPADLFHRKQGGEKILRMESVRYGFVISEYVYEVKI